MDNSGDPCEFKNTSQRMEDIIEQMHPPQTIKTLPTASSSHKRSYESLQTSMRSLYGALLNELTTAQEQGRFCLVFNHPGLDGKGHNLLSITKFLNQYGYEAVGEIYLPSKGDIVIISMGTKAFKETHPSSKEAKTDAEKAFSLSYTGSSLYITWGTDEEILYCDERIPVWRERNNR